jgi:signal transduction histidine kinase
MHDDLGAGLSTIRMISELAVQKDADALKQDIRRISVRSEELVESMRQMIWAMSSNSNSLEDMVVYIRGYSRQYLDDHQLNLQFDIPENIPEVLITGPVKRNLFLVVKEVLHNIVKHAKASSVNIIMDCNQQRFSVTIVDDGVGLSDSGNNRFGNGLKNMERRIGEINGKLMITSSSGTRVVIEIPL